MGKRRKVNESTLAPAERANRERQRQVQAKARELQATGRSYDRKEVKWITQFTGIAKEAGVRGGPGLAGGRGGSSSGHGSGGGRGGGGRGGGGRGGGRGGWMSRSDYATENGAPGGGCGGGGGGNGEWDCPDESCGNLNFHFRTECNRCGKAKPDGATAAPRPAGGNSGSKGEWDCPDESCGNLNFHFRTVCNRCGKAKPVGATTAPRASGGGSSSGEWDCPDESCGNLNFHFRTECNRCGKANQAGAAPAGKSVREDGKWDCVDAECGNLNFAFRTECNKCGKAKPEVTAAAPAAASKACDGEWDCPEASCGNLNFAFRTECNRCGAAKPAGAGSTASVPRADGKWDCPDKECSNLNFAFRTECNKCGAVKPAAAKSAAPAVKRTPGGQMAGFQGQGLAGEWNCADVECGNLNFHYRTECNRCGKAKPADSDTSDPAGPSTEKGGREGEWNCPDATCGNVNFAFRTECNRCGTEKPGHFPDNHPASSGAYDASEHTAHSNGQASWEVRPPSDPKLLTAMQMGSKHDLVVIPIFWKQKQDERLAILEASETAKQYLSKAGLNVWVDQRTKYSPGQKFAYWEHLGVMLRIEVGPSDLGKSTCTLCKSLAPGDYKSVIKMPGLPWQGRQLLQQVRELGGLAIAAKIAASGQKGDRS